MRTLKFVSYYKEHTTVPIRKFNPVKDASDTEIAVRLALELKVKELWILGGTGTRIDHVLANIQVLKIPYDAGVEAYIVDVCNKISLIGKETCLKKEDAFGPYFSVFPLGGIVEHFSLEGAKYPLCDHTLCPYDSLCVMQSDSGRRSENYFSERIGNIDGDKRRRIRVLC